MPGSVPLIALKPFVYARKALRRGSSLSASPRDAKLLTAIGYAKHKPAPKPETDAVPVAGPDAAPDKPRRRRQKAAVE